jgi:hypothetical protein
MVAFVAGSVTVAVVKDGWRVAGGNVLLNLLLLAYLSTGVVLYLRLRYGRWTNPLKSHAGDGDLLFVLGMTPLFAPREYLLVLLAGLVVSLLWWGAMRLGKRRKITVPLVGTLGCCLGIYLIYNVI